MKPWIYAIVFTAVVYALIYQFEKNKPDSWIKSTSNKVVLVLCIFIASSLFLQWANFGDNGHIDGIEKLATTPSKVIESDLLKNINQNVHVGLPPF
jgi:hypothetical protein